MKKKIKIWQNLSPVEKYSPRLKNNKIFITRWEKKMFDYPGGNLEAM